MHRINQEIIVWQCRNYHMWSGNCIQRKKKLVGNFRTKYTQLYFEFYLKIT